MGEQTKKDLDSGVKMGILEDVSGGANQRSWLAPPETSSRIPILTALSKSFLVCSLIANGTGITLDVRFAFMPLLPSLNSAFILSTFIIESGCVWQIFMELDLNTLIQTCRKSNGI